MGEYERTKKPNETAVVAPTSRPRTSAPKPKQVGKPIGSDISLMDLASASRAEAEPAVIAAMDVIKNERQTMISSAPARFQRALQLLYAATVGQRNGKHLTGDEQVSALDVAMVLLEPAVSVFRRTEDDARWLTENLMQYVTWKRSSARYTRALNRVDNSLRIDGATIEIPSDARPREQAALLHKQIAKLAPTMLALNEQVLRGNEHAIEKEAEKLVEGEGKGRKLTAGSLVQLQAMLWLVDGFLTLSDEEFRHELGHIEGVFNGVASYSELVKVATELLGGSLVTTASLAGGLAKLAGDTSSASLCAGVARSTGMVFANVIAGVEIVHGLFVLVDPHASAEKKVNAATGVASGTAWFIGVKTGGAAVGFAASTAILLGFAELKYAAHLYWGASLGLTTGLIRLAFETIQRDGTAIATAAERLARASDLLRSEREPDRIADLQRVHDRLVLELAGAIDYLLDDAAPRGFESGIARYPGAWPIFRELFAPLATFKGSKTESDVVEAAKQSLAKITWALNHAADIVVTSARRRDLGQLEHDLATRESESHREE